MLKKDLFEIKVFKPLILDCQLLGCSIIHFFYVLLTENSKLVRNMFIPPIPPSSSCPLFAVLNY